jgi:hypothetical protein
LDREALVRNRVHEYYWAHDWNCAVATLRVLAEVLRATLSDQVLDAALGMHGAGGYGAQCGLVESALMFIGVVGRERDLSDDAIVQACHDHAEQFERRFGSLLCRELRPAGFKPGNPAHLCEGLTRDAIAFSLSFVSDLLEGVRGGK